MKIERISDTQIRCTLSRKDLNDRELRISELAYGSDKAKALFREMIQQASYECGFEADDIPLMIEAIPISPESLVLVITKVEDPDELDTRFSNFTPFSEEDSYVVDSEDDAFADEIINCFQRIGEMLGNKELPDTNSDDSALDQEAEKNTDNEVVPTSIPGDFAKIYSFRSLEEVTRLAKILHLFYNGKNTLYKQPQSTKYYLVIHISQHTAEEFNKICNIISEYGKSERVTYASVAYYIEHFETIISDQAIQKLANL